LLGLRLGDDRQHFDTGSPHNAPDVKPAIQSPIFLDRLMLALHVAKVRIPENGFGANPESFVILYE